MSVVLESSILSTAKSIVIGLVCNGYELSLSSFLRSVAVRASSTRRQARV